MTNGFGAGFGGLMLYALLLATAVPLAVTAGAALYWRGTARLRYVEYVAGVLTAFAVAVTGFAVLALVDEAPAFAALFAVTAALPLLLVAARSRWRGAAWLTATATAGTAWSVPFVLSVGLLAALAGYTDLSTPLLTALAGVVATGGALLVGERLNDALVVGNVES